MGDTGKMHDCIDLTDERAPFDRARQVGDRHHLHRAGKDVGRRAHGGAYAVALRRQVIDERASDEAGGTGDEHAHQDLPRAKCISSQPTATAAATSEANETMLLAAEMEIRASATSTRLTAVTRVTISATVKPRSRAR